MAGTIAVSVALGLIVASIIIKMVADRKKRQNLMRLRKHKLRRLFRLRQKITRRMGALYNSSAACVQLCVASSSF